LRYNFFSYFAKSLVGCTLHLKIEFLFFFIFRCRQANIGRTVVDTREKFIGGVVDTGAQFFGGVVDTGDKF
jgi:hypothetical protein